MTSSGPRDVGWQRLAAREAQLLDARMRVYGDCAAALYEYERAMYGRARARIDGKDEAEREVLRQEAYRCEVRAKSVIGQVTFLSGTESLEEGFEAVRESVAGLNHITDRKKPYQHQREVHVLRDVLRRVRAELRA